MLALFWMLGVIGYGQRSMIVGGGTTFTDYCGTVFVGRMFYGNEGKVGEFVYGNGVYVMAGKGRYPEWNAGKAKDHYKVGGGFMWGSYWMEELWWPTLNIGLSRHWLDCYPGFEKIKGAPVFGEWTVDFGSSAQIGWYYNGVLVSIGRQLEMTVIFGVAF